MMKKIKRRMKPKLIKHMPTEDNSDNESLSFPDAMIFDIILAAIIIMSALFITSNVRGSVRSKEETKII